MHFKTITPSHGKKRGLSHDKIPTTGEQVFFIYDHTVLQKEEDDLKDAIIYFHPSSVSVNAQCNLCGQLMGMVAFFKHFHSPPRVMNLQKSKFAVKHDGQYTLALCGESSDPNSLLLRQLDSLYNIFRFYHRSIDTVTKPPSHKRVMLLQPIWDYYLANIRQYGDVLASAFNIIPWLDVPKSSPTVYLRASYLLQTCQRIDGVRAGCLFFKNRVLCSQLQTDITSKLLVLRPRQNNFPCHTLSTEFQLPAGVRILRVCLTKEEVKRLSPARRFDRSSSNSSCSSEYSTSNSSTSTSGSTETSSHDPGMMTDSTLEPPSSKTSDGDRSLHTDGSALESSLTSSSQSKTGTGDSSSNRDSVLVIVDVKDDEVVFREEKLSQSRPADKCADVLVESDLNDNHAVSSTAIDSHGNNTQAQNVQSLELTKEKDSSLKISHFADHGVSFDQIAGNSLECTNSVVSDSTLTDSSLCRVGDSNDEQSMSASSPQPVEFNHVASSVKDAGLSATDEVLATSADPASPSAADKSVAETPGLWEVDCDGKLRDSNCDSKNTVDCVSHSVDDQSVSKHSCVPETIQGSNQVNCTQNDIEGLKNKRTTPQNIMLTHPPRRASTGVVESQTKRLFLNVKRVVSNTDPVATYGNVLKDVNKRHNSLESVPTQSEPKQPDSKSEMDLIRARINSMSPSDKMRRSQVMYRTRTYAYRDSQGLYRSKSCSQADKVRLRPASPSPTNAFIHAPVLTKATSDSMVPALSEQPEDFTLPFEKQPPTKNILLSKRIRSESKFSHLHVSGSVSLPVSTESEKDKSSDKNNSSSENLKTNIEDKAEGLHGHRRTVSFQDPEIEANISKSSLRRSKRTKKRQRSRHASSDSEKEGPSDGLTEFDLYIQANSDMLLMLLLDRNAGRAQDTVHGLWRVALPQLGELDVNVKECVNLQDSTLDVVKYHFLKFDRPRQNLTGNTLSPIKGPEIEFCETAMMMHEEFQMNPNLHDMVLRPYCSLVASFPVYGQRSLAQEQYFQQQSGHRTGGHPSGDKSHKRSPPNSRQHSQNHVTLL